MDSLLNFAFKGIDLNPSLGDQAPKSLDFATHSAGFNDWFDGRGRKSLLQSLVLLGIPPARAYEIRMDSLLHDFDISQCIG